MSGGNDGRVFLWTHAAETAESAGSMQLAAAVKPRAETARDNAGIMANPPCKPRQKAQQLTSSFGRFPNELSNKSFQETKPQEFFTRLDMISSTLAVLEQRLRENKQHEFGQQVGTTFQSDCISCEA